MKRLLAIPLVLGLNGEAEAKDTGMTAPYVAEHCQIDASPKVLGKLTFQFASDLGAALEVSADENEDFERKTALAYLAEVKKIPYSKIQTDFAKLQRTTNLEDAGSIAEANKQLSTLKEELAKADKLLDEHAVPNGGGTYDIAYFTPDYHEVIEADVSATFEKYKGKGIDCGSDVQAFVLEHSRFPGEGEVISTLIKDASAEELPPILPEVASFDEEKDNGDLKTAKANFMRESAEFQHAFLVSEAKSARARALIETKYLNSNK